MKILVSHPTSNQNNRAALIGLAKSKILYKFITCIAVFPKTFLAFLSGFKPFKELNRRYFDGRFKNRTDTYPFYEFFRLVSNKLGFKSLTKHELGLFSIDSIYKNLDKRVANKIQKNICDDLDAVYAYEDGALYSFKAAKAKGIKCLYDLPIGYWKASRDLLQNEIEAWPEWKETLHGFRDSEEKLKRKDKELQNADQIYVASSFTAQTLNYYSGKLPKIHVIPYGFPKPIKNRKYSSTENRPIKLLFVGGLSQRKGIANIFAAVDRLGDKVQLTIVGQKPTNNCEALNKYLTKYRWIPSLPHQKVLDIMQEHDVFLFPSLFEGFGLVITEAMSQGTPVITTNRTAGPDLITHDVNGWIIEAGSTSALFDCVDDIVKNPKKIEAAGKAAIETAKSRPWDVYGDELAKTIIKNMN